MTILQEILKWSEGLPRWQSDAVSRLLTRGELSADDLDDLFALLKAEHGIADPKGRVPKPLTTAQIPIPTQNSDHIILLAIKNLRHVNAIAENQRLPIGESGLTVIYGDNGSGKSGYSRLLKKACRARDQSEEIHPNVNLPNTSIAVAEADFEVSVNGEVRDVHWVNSDVAPNELSALAIFDSRCARAYLDNEDDFSYVPYGLDIFEGLAKVCNQLKGKIEAESTQNAVDLTVFSHLHGDTVVGKLMASLSAKTKIDQIDRLVTLTDEELTQHSKLENSLKESNPKDKAVQLRLRARRIATIAESAVSKAALVNHSAVTKLRSIADSFRSAQAAATLAAQQFKEGQNLLPGTGGEVWRELFEAARKFSLESHPNKSFPQLEADALCPLCQQPLEEGAERLLHFETFIQQEVEKTVQDRRTELAAAYKLFVSHSLILNIDDVIYSEIEALEPQLAIDIRAFEQALITYQENIKSAVVSHQWEEVNQVLVTPVVRLQNLINKLNAEAEALEKASDEKERARLQKIFNELDARIRLRQVKDAVLAVVSKMSQRAKLMQCLSAIRTNSISLKASELAEKVVSRELEETLNREFKALGVGMLRVSLQSRANKGKALHKLKLELPQSRSPGEILSEGEQRAIALGSFLAEVSLNGEKGGVVFDDPVSSLDHRRRERVAQRLVAEAGKRQVIIFTHDIYFLCLLAEEAGVVGVPITTQSLTRHVQGLGVADPELPFEGRSASKRIGALKAQQQLIAKLYRDGNESEFQQQTVDAYFRLRMTWERAVEEVLLQNVVLRFRKGIETQRLASVAVEDDDYAQVYNGMKKCSNYAHDKALLGGFSVPEPHELLEDIMTLECWRIGLDKRSKETLKRRKR